MKKKAVVIVFDSFGLGALPDAYKFKDEGSNTLGNIDKYCKHNNINFNINNLLKLGLGKAYKNLHQQQLFCDQDDYNVIASYGVCQELSTGKDTTSGHWEIAGYPVLFEWGYFKNKINTYPQTLLDKIVALSKIKGFLGNCHASGTDIIRDLGDEHIKTGFPIFYSSADSVFQIACHEKYFGLDNLYKLCEIVREQLSEYNIARVIARPFIGESKFEYTRTGNRKDYSLSPSEHTLLDVCSENKIKTIAIGKIADIYSHRGVDIEIKANGLQSLIDQTISSIKDQSNTNSFIMTNLVDFDMLYGHRRDVVGYKNALEYVDVRIQEILNVLSKDDVLIITADHGCDPTWTGSDHTREYIPFLMYHNNLTINFNTRNSFADIGQTIANFFNIPKLKHGLSVL